MPTKEVVLMDRIVKVLGINPTQEQQQEILKHISWYENLLAEMLER